MVVKKSLETSAEKLLANYRNGIAFLHANKQREGVVELPDGLQYEILKAGNGPKPKIFHTVTCHYQGTLIDGTVFDSSVQRGEPASFPVNMVIAGWTEALQLMPVGSKWKLFIPPSLGYGERQVSTLIEGNSTLIFEIELLDFSL
jgi:FKBP-type peptidyl-prolyl cis-trans isomerase FklB